MIHLDVFKQIKRKTNRTKGWCMMTVYLMTCDSCGIERGYGQKNIKNNKCLECSRVDVSKKLSGENHYNWQGIKLNKICSCGSKKDAYAKTCINCLDQSGNKNPNWKEGGHKTSLQKMIRTDVRYKNWVKSIMLRDDYTCQYTQVRGGNLHVHHHKATLSEMISKAIESGLTNKRDIVEYVLALHNLSAGITVEAKYHKNVLHRKV